MFCRVDTSQAASGAAARRRLRVYDVASPMSSNSWTGVCAYEIELDVFPGGDARVTIAWINRATDLRSARKDEAYEVGVLRWVLHVVLLREPDFPFPR